MEQTKKMKKKTRETERHRGERKNQRDREGYTPKKKQQ